MYNTYTEDNSLKHLGNSPDNLLLLSNLGK